MGLDITVNVSKSEVLDCLKYDDDLVNHPELARSIIADTKHDFIHTQPGSYNGLHIVRQEFIKLHNLEPEKSLFIPESHRKYHLLNFSDCEGWYLPCEFEQVFWTENSYSIGSSYKLLNDLESMELLRATNPEWGWRWDALYLPAVASVVTNTPIRFG